MLRSLPSRGAGLLLALALLAAPARSEVQMHEPNGVGLRLEYALNVRHAAAAEPPGPQPIASLPLRLARELRSLPEPAGAVAPAAPAPITFWILSAILLFLATNIVLLLGFSIVMRIWREIGQRRQARFRAVWEPVLHARVSGDAAPLPALASSERLLFLGLWLHLLGYVRDQAADALVETARELDMPRYALHLLESRSPWKRIVAMRAVAALHLQEAGDALLAKAMEARRRSSLTAVRALLQIDPERGFAGLEHLLSHREWSPAAMAEIVRAGGNATVQKLAGLARSAPPGRARQLVRLIELLEDQTALPTLRERLAATRDAGEISAILHCLGRLGQAEDRDAALAFLGHDSWPIRMQAAFALGALGQAEDLSRLAPLLRDRNWWVRYRCAQSLLRLAGAAALAAMREHEPDPYARDMLDRVLAEGR